MTEYSFSGKIDLGRKEPGFERTVEADSEKHARDKIYSQLGSEHSVSRSKIDIEEVEEE